MPQNELCTCLGRRYREVQHVTQRERAWAAAAWSRLQARRWRRLAAGQPTAHSTSAAPSLGLQRRARVVGRMRHAAGSCTRRSSGPRLLQRGLRVVEALRRSTPGGVRLCVGAPRQTRLPPARRHRQTGRPARVRGETRVASQHKASKLLVAP